MQPQVLLCVPRDTVISSQPELYIRFACFPHKDNVITVYAVKEGGAKFLVAST